LLPWRVNDSPETTESTTHASNENSPTRPVARSLQLADTYPAVLTLTATSDKSNLVGKRLSDINVVSGSDKFLSSLLALETDPSRSTVVHHRLSSANEEESDSNSNDPIKHIGKWPVVSSKVTPDRIYATTFHPTAEKLVVTVGDLSTAI